MIKTRFHLYHNLPRGVRVGYNIEDNGIRIHRMDDAVYQTCGFDQGRRAPLEIMDMFVGELWADEVSEAEANSVTPRVAAESTPCDNGSIRPGRKRCRRRRASVKVA